MVIAIIALLMSILMPALSRVNDQAKNAVCKSNLHQFSIVWKMYLDDSNNKFPAALSGWLFELLRYYKDEDLLICPYANKTDGLTGTRGGKHYAWSDRKYGRTIIASYGINQYCTSSNKGGRERTELIPNATISQANRIPLMGDCASAGVTPLEADIPPEFDGQTYYGNTDIEEIRSFCMNRHNYHINMLFLDWSVQSVGLKDLWVLKWKKDWNLPPEPLPIEFFNPEHWMYILPNPPM